jgi:hypothetical protein
MLDRKAILATQDLDIKKVDVPEWGGEVAIRGLTARERDLFEMSIGASVNLDNLRARLVVLTLCDDEGVRLLKDADAKQLGEKNAQVVDRLFEVARQMSGMTDADVKELEGN